MRKGLAELLCKVYDDFIELAALSERLGLSEQTVGYVAGVMERILVMFVVSAFKNNQMIFAVTLRNENLSTETAMYEAIEDMHSRDIDFDSVSTSFGQVSADVNSLNNLYMAPNDYSLSAMEQKCLDAAPRLA